MAANSTIEWTDATWNVLTGCSRISSGCRHCYAERLAATRLRRHPSRAGLVDERGRWTGEVRFNRDWLDQPLRWQRPRRVFVCAHADLFHEAVPAAWIDRVFAVMALAPRHQYQVLTKRPHRMRDYLSGPARDRVRALLADWHDGINDPPVRPARRQDPGWPLPQVWLGVSVEDQLAVAERVPALLSTPATIRWLSVEPLLAAVTLFGSDGRGAVREVDAGLDWVVVGGESGPGARPPDVRWVRALREECRERGIPFFFKQWGGTNRKRSGRRLDGRTWDELPVVP